MKSQAQQAAWERNHRIMRLRAMHATAKDLLPNSYAGVQGLIDAQLLSMGALTMAQHQKKLESK